MKTFTLTAMALLAAVTSAPHAAQQVAKELEPSLAIFKTVSSPMPDFRRPVTFYQAFPDSQGALARGMGHSDFVRGWFRQMEPVVPRFAQLDARLRMDVGVYADTVREQGRKVLDATTDLKKSLNNLDRVTFGKVQDLLSDYNDEIGATRLARREFEAATKHAEEAGYMLDASDAGATECNALLKRSKLEAEKAALIARMQKDMMFLDAVDQAIKAMTGGLAGATAYVAENVRSSAKTIIVEAFHTGTRDTLYEIESKIEAIDKAIAHVKCKPQQARLKAAKSNLEARIIEVLVPFGKILDHRAKAWRAVDRLGTLKDPKTGRTVPFFENLQTYNSQVNLMGRQVFDAVNAYLDFLNREPMSRGPLLVAYVEEDIETVGREKPKRDPSGKWTIVAFETRQYLETYTKWYSTDIRRGQTVLTDLREGKHLDFVDRMLGRATRELGGTVSYENVIR